MSSGNLLEFPQPFTANLIVLYIDISYGAYMFFSSFPDLSDSEVELTIVRGLNIPLPSGEYFDLLLVINWIQNLLPINYQSFKASGKGLGSLVILNITNFASTYCNWPQWAHQRGRPEFWLVWISFYSDKDDVDDRFLYNTFHEEILLLSYCLIYCTWPISAKVF